MTMFASLLFALTLAAHAATLQIAADAGITKLTTFEDWTRLGGTADSSVSVWCKRGEGCAARNGEGKSAPLTGTIRKGEVRFGFKAGADLSSNFQGNTSVKADTVFVLQMNKADLTEQLAFTVTGGS